MDNSVPRLGTPKTLDRVSISAKRVINGQADVNQLVPIAYKWAWDKYLAACANHSYQYIVESLGLDEGEIFNALPRLDGAQR